MSKQDDLHDVLRGLHHSVDGMNGAVLASRDGLPIAATVSDAQAEHVAAMAATVQALAEQSVPDHEQDPNGQAVIRGRRGCLVVYGAGPLAVLAVQTGARPNLGLVHVEGPRAAGSLAGLIG